jgi:hypothetical protein
MPQSAAAPHAPSKEAGTGRRRRSPPTTEGIRRRRTTWALSRRWWEGGGARRGLVEAGVDRPVASARELLREEEETKVKT